MLQQHMSEEALCGYDGKWRIEIADVNVKTERLNSAGKD